MGENEVKKDHIKEFVVLLFLESVKKRCSEVGQVFIRNRNSDNGPNKQS